MKLQYSILFFAIINVVWCYPSSDDNDSHLETIFGPSESISRSVSMPLSYLDESKVAKDNNFPEVEYPAKILDMIGPFYYRAVDYDDTLAQFSGEVKNSFKSLETERKVKEYSVLHDSASSKDINIEETAIEGDNPQINDAWSYNVSNTSDASVCKEFSQAASDKVLETSNATHCQLNLDKQNIVSTSMPTDSTETSVPTQDQSSEHSNETINVKQTLEGGDNAQINDPLPFNVANTSDVGVCEVFSLAASEEEEETSEATSCQCNLNNENIEHKSIPTDSTEISVTSQNDSEETGSLDYENKENINS